MMVADYGPSISNRPCKSYRWYLLVIRGPYRTSRTRGFDGLRFLTENCSRERVSGYIFCTLPRLSCTSCSVSYADDLSKVALQRCVV